MWLLSDCTVDLSATKYTNGHRYRYYGEECGVRSIKWHFWKRLWHIYLVAAWLFTTTLSLTEIGLKQIIPIKFERFMSKKEDYHISSHYCILSIPKNEENIVCFSVFQISMIKKVLLKASYMALQWHFHLFCDLSR